jgi:TonB-linked SusC/RagA family outer membrane protein
MKRIKGIILLILVLCSFLEAFPQGRVVIRGRVIDRTDKSTVIGANIIEFDSENRVIGGTITNVNGDFVLEMRNSANMVRVSVIGYNSREVKPDPSKPMMIEIESSDVEIGEVTITARAQTSNRLTNIDERDNASASVKIDLMDMAETGLVSAADALQGKVTGLDIISASGDPGSGSSLVIRGLSSMGNSRPLIVIDGVPQDRVQQGFDLASADSEDISNLINIALQDIKSIEVLKDAAATAIYGSRGADGVLLIETHKGRMGKVQFDYQYKNTMNFQPPAIPMLNGDEYIMLQLEQWHNAYGVFEIPREIAYDRDYVDFYNYSANTDWIGALTRNSLTNDHYFKISGGGERTRYFTSLSYVDEQGTTIGTSAKRFSTRINLDYFLSRKLLFTVQFNYISNDIEGNVSIDNRNVRSMAYIKAPNMSIWEHDQFGNLTGEYFNPITSYQGGGVSFFNPVAVATLGRNDRMENSLQNTFRLRYNINDWLIFNQMVSFQYTGAKSKNFLPYNAIGAQWLDWQINKAEEANNINSSIQTESQIIFNSPFRTETHILTGAVAWITNQSQYEWMNIQSNRTPSTSIQDPAINAQINWIGTGTGEGRDVAVTGNLNYKLLDRYGVTTIFRSDGNAAYGKDNRWGNFVGVSGFWRFSSEPWMETIEWLGESKLKASWGLSGSNRVGTYDRFATYVSTNTGSYINNPAIIPSNIQLNNLKWETISSTNYGIEVNLFDDKLFLNADIYRKVTQDLLFRNYDIPYSSGFSQLSNLNGGEMENRGWEMMMNWRVINKRNFSISLDFNTSQNINSFNKLPENFNTEASTSITNGQFPRRVVAGEPIGSFFGFRYLGVWANDADVVAKDANGSPLVDADGIAIPLTYQGTYIFRGGDSRYEDVNHDGVIDLNDVVYIGDSNPDFIGGFGTTVKYKNFDFQLGFHYRLGFDIINGVAIETQGMLNRNNQSKAVLSRWRVQGQDEIGMLPRAYLNHPANNLGSDRYVEKGDFLRLNNMKVGYRLSQRMCNKLGLRSLSMALSARKLITFTNYTGQDPEVGQNASDPFWIGVDRANTPPPKTFTFSLSVGF